MPRRSRRPLFTEEDAAAGASHVSSPDAARPAAHTAAAELQQQSSAAPVLPAPAPAPGAAPDMPAFKQPCTLKGAASAVYAGMLGYFLGIVPAAIRLKGRQWGMAHAQGLASAQQLALMSGVYTAVHCIGQRIRLVEDGWNRGIAGCSTGLVLGWNNGPWGALQSCAGIGLISALIDLGGGAVEAAEARALQSLQDVQLQRRQLQHTHRLQHQEELQPATAAHSVQQQGGQLHSLPAPMQLALLLLGAPPSSMTSSSSRITEGTNESCTERSQQRRRRWGRRREQAEQDGAMVIASQQQQERQQHKHQQRWGAAAAAEVLQPALDPVQRLLLAAPPLMFLGACCSNDGMGSSSSSSSRALATAAAAGAPSAAAAGWDVDGCPVVAAAGRR